MNAWQGRSRSWTSDAPEQEYWLSYSDLMAGLLMVFALMLLAALYHYGRLVDEAGNIAATRMEIISILQEVMEADSSGVTVDPITGAVKFPEGVLFPEGQHQLQTAGQRQLNSFSEKYFGVLLGNPKIRDQLKSIVIEGHTNDNYIPGHVGDNLSYGFNLELSQRRALSVMRYLMLGNAGYREQLMEYVTASGRSFSRPICSDGEVHSYPCPKEWPIDKNRSRRIEISFRLKDEELLERIRKLLVVK